MAYSKIKENLIHIIRIFKIHIIRIFKHKAWRIKHLQCLLPWDPVSQCRLQAQVVPLLVRTWPRAGWTELDLNKYLDLN